MAKARIISIIATGIISLHLWLGLPRFISAKEWTKQIVHSEIGHLTNTSIALDNNNNPHVMVSFS